MLPRILVIAGSDSSGGAGIQADIKTITMLGGYAMTAITALTAQNTCGVQHITITEPDMLSAQIDACVEDIGVDVIKTGMIPDAASLSIVRDTISRLQRPVVFDPVMVASSGATLQQAGLQEALLDMLPLLEVITPNIPEAQTLTGLPISTREGMETAAQALRAKGARAVVLKGGHLPGESVVDLLLTTEGPTWLEQPRIETRHTHGTGCTLASAIATYLGLGHTLEQAVRHAQAYVYQAIADAPGLGEGYGPLHHAHPLHASG